MISLSVVIGDVIKTGRRILKVMQYGAKTAAECAPFGDDSSPIKGMTAIYVQTDEIGDPVIVGYINQNQKAAAGEKRFYSLDEDGNEKCFIWLKNNGDIELGGNTDNLVKFTPLNTAINTQTTLINTELTKIAAAIALLGGSYTVAPISTDISQSKADKLKCS